MGGTVREVRLDELKPGDIVAVYWLDASEGRQEAPIPSGVFDTPVVSYGVYLGTYGRRAKHIVVVKEVVMDEVHYNAIPVGMVERVERLSKRRVGDGDLRKIAGKMPRGRVRKGLNQEAKTLWRVRGGGGRLLVEGSRSALGGGRLLILDETDREALRRIALKTVRYWVGGDDKEG